MCNIQISYQCNMQVTLTVTFQGHSRPNMTVSFGSPNYDKFNRLNTTPSRDRRLPNLSDLDFDLSRSLKGKLRVKYDGAIGLPIYDLELMFQSNIWPIFQLVYEILAFKM